MLESEKHLMRAMYGGPIVKIEKKLFDETIDTKVCDCNDKGVTPELMKKYIRRAITEIQTLLYVKKGLEQNSMPDIFDYYKTTKHTMEHYHHRKYKRVVTLTSEADSITVPPMGSDSSEQIEILDE